MTKAALERLVRVWQGRLDLSHWRVVVDWDTPASEGAHATVERHNDYDKATIRFPRDEWSRWSREFAAETVVHELIHLHMREVDRVVADIDGQLHRDAAILFDRRYEHESEAFVDRLSLLFVRLGGDGS